MATKKSSENKSRDGVNLSENLEKLAAIAAWFDDQEEVDIEEGLLKVKMAAGLIKESRGRLSEF